MAKLIVILTFCVLALAYGASWLMTCGLIKIITLLFGLPFSWAVATGIWLILCLLSSIFKSST